MAKILVTDDDRSIRLLLRSILTGAGHSVEVVVGQPGPIGRAATPGSHTVTIGFGAGGSELSTFVEGYQMTATGLRKLGSGTIDAKGSKAPGAALGAAGWLVTGNPIGLVVGGGMKIYGEASGKATVEGRAKATAKEIADVLKTRFQEQGWISK